ncbi:hypothetical protein [Kluyvera ascorbata]|uniref:hypothetical protein n=1 Tax=Kluyvera ascorbata TaxID=51288 RepID=UPI0028E006F2|nr:hypothetical protein [Kluyvera ascorbata]MDT8700622.1 hypothetical protein [Kluyvera ascorbata]
MNNKLTIITPSFEKHCLQFSRMIKSISDNCVDKENLDIIVIVESCNTEMFTKIATEYPSVSLNIITTEDVLERFHINETPSSFLKRIGKFTFQTIKKFGGIIHAKTHWSLVLDSETVFYNKFSASELLENYAEKKYIFYTETSARGSRWKQSTGLRVNTNTEKALNIPEMGRWYMDIFHWFYEKDKVEDLLNNKLGNDWWDSIRSSNSEFDFFECILYYAYINHYHSNEYQILNLKEELSRYVDEEIAGRFKLDELPFSLHGNDFLLSIVGSNEVCKLNEFFEYYKLPFIRLEPAYIDDSYISELKKLPYFCATISTQYLMWMGRKIAICLSGKFSHEEFRGYEQQVRSIVGFLSGVNCDIYIHGWRQSCEAYIIDNLKPKAYLFEEQLDFSQLASRITHKESSYLKEHRDEGVLSMFYSMERAFSLIDTPNDYDYIIRLRPDIYSHYSLKEILFSISDNGDFIPNVIYTPSVFLSKGINDQFAIGNSKLMSKYFSVYSYVKDQIDNVFFNPENILATYLISNNIDIALLDMPYALHRGVTVRPHNTVALLNEQECTWWARTTNIAKLQIVTEHFSQRRISGELLNTLPKNVRFLGQLANDRKILLIESYDYDPYVNVRACINIFGMYFPVRVRNVKGMKSYIGTNFYSYYCISIENSKMIVNQTISDMRSVRYSTLVCKSYKEISKSNIRLLPVYISIPLAVYLRKLIRFGRSCISRLKLLAHSK